MFDQTTNFHFPFSFKTPPSPIRIWILSPLLQSIPSKQTLPSGSRPPMSAPEPCTCPSLPRVNQRMSAESLSSNSRAHPPGAIEKIFRSRSHKNADSQVLSEEEVGDEKKRGGKKGPQTGPRVHTGSQSYGEGPPSGQVWMTREIDTWSHTPSHIPVLGMGGRVSCCVCCGRSKLV